MILLGTIATLSSQRGAFTPFVLLCVGLMVIGAVWVAVQPREER